MAQLICRVPWEPPLPTAEAAAEADITAWLVPCRWTSDEQLVLACPLETLAEAFPGIAISLECEVDHPLTPADEQKLAQALRPYLQHPCNLRVENRPLLWIRKPEHLSHPLFGLKRLKLGIQNDPLLLAAASAAPNEWEGVYAASERIPLQRLRNGLNNYESFLFHAHHPADPSCRLAVPCVRGDIDGTMAHSSPELYRHWLVQASAWCDLRHTNTDHRWVLVERWDDHLRWWMRPASAQARYPASIPATERRWGAMDPSQPALLIHGFHLNILEAMLQPLSANTVMRSQIAIYVSTPHHQLDAVEQMIRNQGWPAACLVGVENRGRDMAPFLLELLPRAYATGHPWLAKLHTKRSPDKPGGEAWGVQLLQSLATPEALAAIGERFASEPKLKCLAPQACLIPATVHLGGNQQHLNDLLGQVGLTPAAWMQQTFVAGSMWAARTSALEPLLDLVLSLEQFEAEQGQTDATLAHACERLIPALLQPGPEELHECDAAAHGPGMSCPPFGYAWADGSR